MRRHNYLISDDISSSLIALFVVATTTKYLSLVQNVISTHVHAGQEVIKLEEKHPGKMQYSSMYGRTTNVVTLFLSYSSFSMIIFLVLSTCTIEAAFKALLHQNETFLAIHASGDSVLETGNNNNLKTISKCNFPPYGRDFREGKPTGRFCNGKIISDFIGKCSLNECFRWKQAWIEDDLLLFSWEYSSEKDTKKYYVLRYQ